MSHRNIIRAWKDPEYRLNLSEAERSENRPTLNGAEVNVLDYADAIEIGFRRVYQLLPSKSKTDSFRVGINLLLPGNKVRFSYIFCY